jgi:UDP-glucose 4-epimerase
LINKVIILGSQGFIGSSLCKYFTSLKIEVLGIDIVEHTKDCKYNYIQIPESLELTLIEILSTFQFDLMINASGSGNVSLSLNNPEFDFKSNVTDVMTVLNCLKNIQPTCKYIHISSAAVYGNPKSFPISENDILSPISPYGYHKLMSEMLCKEYKILFNLGVTIVRPFSVYGEGLKKQLIWDLSQKVFSSKNKKVQVFGTGFETRDFIYIDDLIKCIYLIAINSNFDLDVYNIGSGIELSINEVVESFKNRYPHKEFIFTNEVRIADPYKWKADISKISQLGFSPEISFKEGVSRYFSWFEKFYSNAI